LAGVAQAGQLVSVLDYGADPNGVNPSSTAIQSALNVSGKVYFPPGRYSTPVPITYNGTVEIYGAAGPNGKSLSTLTSDQIVFHITNGSNSVVRNLNLENVTTPRVIKRDRSDWPDWPWILVDSNELGFGYQAASGDITNNTPQNLLDAIQAPAIGPTILFDASAAASVQPANVLIDSIQGRFLTIALEGYSYSTVQNSNFKAGKDTFAGIYFTNWNFGQARGIGNRALGNTITEASNSGIMFGANDYGVIQNNVISNVGESGIKTYQGSFCYDSTGQLITSGNICPSGTIIVSARDTHMYIVGNTISGSHYEGIDACSDYAPFTGLYDGYHAIAYNSVTGNHGLGENSDARHDLVIGNVAQGNGLGGVGDILGDDNYIVENHLDSNLMRLASGYHDLAVQGDNNVLINNVLTGTNYMAGAGLTNSRFSLAINTSSPDNQECGNVVNGVLNPPPGGTAPTYAYLTGAVTPGSCSGVAPPILAVPLAPAVTAKLSQPITLSAAFQGSPTNYQWFKNGVSIVGATTPTLTLSGLRTDAATYKIVAFNQFGSASSSTTVTEVPPPVGAIVEVVNYALGIR